MGVQKQLDDMQLQVAELIQKTHESALREQQHKEHKAEYEAKLAKMQYDYFEKHLALPPVGDLKS